MTISGFLAGLFTEYRAVGIDLGIDLVAVLVLAYGLYFRRHWRVDLLLSFITLNLGIFVVMSVLNLVKVDVATGFGLFAILSIIRLRSSAVTQQEVAYYFVALVMGLLNGMGIGDHVLVVGLNILLLATMAVFDSKRLRARSRRVEVQIKGRYASEAVLVAALELELGGRVMSHEVTEVDLVHHNTTVDVRYRPDGIERPVLDPISSPEPAVQVVDAPAAEVTAAEVTASAARTGELVLTGAGRNGSRPDHAE